MTGNELKRTLCPFCGYGCELEIVFDDFGVRGVEYPKDAPNRGRLCPRGSAAALCLDHPRRLNRPLRNNRPVAWERVNRDLARLAAEPEKLAVVFDRNITIEEYRRIAAFCRAHSIDQFASAYIESESALTPLIREQAPFSLDEIGRMQVICLVGDVFNLSPMISQEIIDWRLRDRKNRLVVVDSLKTHTAAFATDFLKVRSGTEPLALLALARAGLNDRGNEDATGVAPAVFNNVSQLLKSAGPAGLVFATVPFGRSYDDSLWTDGLCLLRELTGMKLVPLYEFAGRDGGVDLAVVLNRIKSKQIKNLLCLGELFPGQYPQLSRELKGAATVIAVPWRSKSGTALPVALNIEKAGTITTIFGDRPIGGAVPPPGGVRTILDLLPPADKDGESGKNLPAAAKRAGDLKKRIEQALERSRPAKKKTYRLVGEKLAFSFGGLFEPEAIKVNPADAQTLRIMDGDAVVVESAQSRQVLPAKIAQETDPGVVAVPAESGSTRGLFDYWIDDQTVRFVPTEVMIWRKE